MINLIARYSSQSPSWAGLISVDDKPTTEAGRDDPLLTCGIVIGVISSIQARGDISEVSSAVVVGAVASLVCQFAIARIVVGANSEAGPYVDIRALVVVVAVIPCPKPGRADCLSENRQA